MRGEFLLIITWFFVENKRFYTDTDKLSQIRISQRKLQPVQWANHTTSASIQNMCVNHGRAYIAMPQQLLDCPDIITNFKKMCCKGMTEGVAAGVFVYTGF